MANRNRPDRCRNARELKGWTQADAAKALGWHINTVRKYERTTSKRFQPYVELAKAYGVTLDWLIAGGNPTPVLSSQEAKKQEFRNTVRYLKQTLITALDAIERAERWLEDVNTSFTPEPDGSINPELKD